MAQAAPVISGLYPNGAYKFQASSTLSFTASSTVAITNVTLQLSASQLTGGGTIIRNLSSIGGGLTISGPATGETVSAGLSSNRVYTAVINITDANGATATTNISFDTISGYTFEAEDFDYNSGQFIDNPQTNAYGGLQGVGGVDVYNLNGSGAYRPVGTAANNGGGLATENGANTGDTPPRAQYLGTTNVDYDVGYTDSGDWGNYTRHYPAGVYNVFMRAANPNGPSTDSADISVVAGSASFNTPGTFSVATTGGWQIYNWVPLVDSSANLVQLTIPNDGSGKSLNTLRATTDAGGSYNVNFYLLGPTNAPPVPGEAIVTNQYPDGAFQFESTNQLVFNVISTNGVNAGDITLQLSATNLAGVGSTKLLTSGSGLTVTGASTNLLASAALTTNTVYHVFVQVIDSFGNISTTNYVFDTVIPAYTFEAEDWNYNSGLYIDNPQTNEYGGQDGQDGVLNVDFYDSTGGYIGAYNRLGLNSEGCGDVPRANHGGLADYDIGNTVTGQWANYTRHFPAGIYNIYVRVARANSGTVADAGSISLVNGDVTTSDQAAQQLGKYSAPDTGNWQGYVWTPVINSGGSMARFIADGSAKTLRLTLDGAGHNINYIMLIPADLSVNPPPFVSAIYPDGSQPFQFTNKLAFIANSSVGISTNNITMTIDGGTVSGLLFNGSSTAWNVSFPVTANGFHTAVIKLVDTAGTTYYTNQFDTFNPSTYTFEVEDNDYNGGQFFDNPQIGAYAGLSGILNVDDHWDYNVGQAYRPLTAGSGEGLSTEAPSGDYVRPGYTGFDYDVGHNDGGNWANYTRHYPAGTYNIWVRFASPNGNPTTPDAARFSLVAGGWGTTSQTLSELGTFTTHNTGGWGNYTGGWAPLIDANGNYVKWTASGSTNTLRYTIDSGGFNEDFFALVPADTTRPTIANLYPNGLTQFQGTNTLSFDAVSSAGIATNSIVVTVNGVVVNNLTFTGSSTDWHVSDTNLTDNTFYSVGISFGTVVGGSYSTTFNFDTYSATNYQWEAEDWDYTSNGVSGLFIDNPQVDEYAGLDATEGIDVSQINTNTLVNPYDYRAYDGVNLTPAQEPSGDLARPQFGTNVDYKIDWFGYGSWCNYTRHYPAGTYYVVGRFTEGSAATVANLGKVTSGHGTASQVVSTLGTFFIPLGNWTSAQSVYLTDSESNLVAVTLDGSQTTLRLSGNPNEANDPTINAGYLMLVPATVSNGPLNLTAVISGGNIVISFPTRSGSNYQVQYKNNLSDTAWTSLGSPIAGNDSVRSATDPDTATGGHRFYRVQVQ